MYIAYKFPLLSNEPPKYLVYLVNSEDVTVQDLEAVSSVHCFIPMNPFHETRLMQVNRNCVSLRGKSEKSDENLKAGYCITSRKLSS